MTFFSKGLFLATLAPVVQKLDCSIHQINHYVVDKYQGNQHAIHWIEVYAMCRSWVSCTFADRGNDQKSKVNKSSAFLGTIVLLKQ